MDVLGLIGSQVALVGEARLQSKPLDTNDVARLSAKALRISKPGAIPLLALWSRAGATPAVQRERVLAFKLSEMLVP